MLALLYTATLLDLLLTGWCFSAVRLARGHRAPYTFLFAAFILQDLGNAISIVLQIISNELTQHNGPNPHELVIGGLWWLFANWGILLVFLSVIAVLRNRETAIRIATKGKPGPNNRFTVAYATLALIIFVLGTTSPVLLNDTIRKYQIGLDGINQQPSANASLPKAELDLWHAQRIDVWSDFDWAFRSFVGLTGVVVVISTIPLWRACRAAGITDKVLNPHILASMIDTDLLAAFQITNTMLYVVAPLYATYILFTYIIPLVLEPQDLTATNSFITLESVMIAHDLLTTLLHFAIAVALLRMSSNRKDWNIPEVIA